MTAKAKYFTGSIAENYRRYLVPLLFDEYARHLLEIADLNTRHSVLELACGTGVLTRYLRTHLPNSARLVATDLNPDMLSIATSDLADLDNVELQIADGMDLPFDDGEFDTVVCQFGIMFFPDKQRGLSEMARVLAPNGKLFLSVWDEMSRNEIMFLTNQAVQGLKPLEPISISRGFSCANIDAMTADIQSGGFEDLDVAVVEKKSRAESLDDALQGVLEGTVLGQQLRAQDLMERGRQAVRATLETAYGENDISAPMRAVFFTATKPHQ